MNTGARIKAIYGRQSVDKKDSISIESQIEFCQYELKGTLSLKRGGWGGQPQRSPFPCTLLFEVTYGTRIVEGHARRAYAADRARRGL